MLGAKEVGSSYRSELNEKIMRSEHAIFSGTERRAQGSQVQ